MSNSCSTTVLAADEKVRITRFDFDPGQETGWHVHEHNYVITAITDCFMVIQHRMEHKLDQKYMQGVHTAETQEFVTTS